MKGNMTIRNIVSLQLFVLVCAVVLGVWVSHFKERTVERKITSYIASQEERLHELATITDRNGADEAIETIIADCPRRDEYESMLIALGTLSKKDLVTLQTLFDSCGNFYAERKALMVSKLERELESYRDYIELYGILRTPDAYTERLHIWDELVTLEKARSTLLTDQSILQAKILTLLISGSSVTGKEVSGHVSEARQIEELLGVQDHTIDELRASLKK